jgi:hypothetical protein
VVLLVEDGPVRVQPLLNHRFVRVEQGGALLRRGRRGGREILLSQVFADGLPVDPQAAGNGTEPQALRTEFPDGDDLLHA